MSHKDEKVLNLAIVGCGAMTEKQHLPSLVGRDDCRVSTLVEINRERAKRLADSFGIQSVFSDHRKLIDSGVDAAVVVLPNHLHAPVTVDLLKSGIHVLVEKPMAPTVAECNTMIEASEEGHALLAVGLMRRYSHAGKFAEWVIKSGLLGRIVSFDLQNGFSASKWPFATDFFLRKELAGGGVLMDLGVHALDQLLWWLGEVESFSYYDDNYGGVEADCTLHLRLKSGAQGVVEISRTRDLRETAIITGDKGKLEVSLVKNFASLHFLESGFSMVGHTCTEGKPALPDQRAADLIAAEHEDFLDAIRTGRRVAVSGKEGRRSIALIEECYANRQLLKLPWIEVELSCAKEIAQ